MNKIYYQGQTWIVRGVDYMESYWVDTTTRPSFSKLDRDIDVDVCIIGAGITGIMSAYMLKNGP